MIFHRIRPQEVGIKGEDQNGGVVNDRKRGGGIKHNGVKIENRCWQLACEEARRLLGASRLRSCHSDVRVYVFVKM